MKTKTKTTLIWSVVTVLGLIAIGFQNGTFALPIQ